MTILTIRWMIKGIGGIVNSQFEEAVVEPFGPEITMETRGKTIRTLRESKEKHASDRYLRLLKETPDEDITILEIIPSPVDEMTDTPKINPEETIDGIGIEIIFHNRNYFILRLKLGKHQHLYYHIGLTGNYSVTEGIEEKPLTQWDTFIMPLNESTKLISYDEASNEEILALYLERFFCSEENAEKIRAYIEKKGKELLLTPICGGMTKTVEGMLSRINQAIRDGNDILSTLDEILRQDIEKAVPPEVFARGLYAAHNFLLACIPDGSRSGFEWPTT